MLAAVVLAGAAAPAPTAFDVDPARSRVVIEVGKAGALSFIAGHSHTVEAPIRGTLSIDPERPEGAIAALEIRTADLEVRPDGEPPEDVPQVQATMTSERVLDVRRDPTMTFQSRGVRVDRRNGAILELTVKGDLTLHGVTRAIEVPVHLEVGPGTVTARGTFSIKQTDYGITPVSAAGGTVRVKDELRVGFEIEGRRPDVKR